MAVVPILVGPLQVLLALLPAILVSLGGIFLALLKPAFLKQTLKLLWRQKWPLLALAGGLGAAVWGLRALIGPRAPSPGGAPDPAAADWPAFRGGPQRHGRVGNAPEPAQGGVVWASTASRTFHASPALVGGRIYVTSAERGVFADRGAVFCLDADSGAVLWKSSPSGYRATFSSPSVSGQYLVCGEGLHFTRDGRVICLDITKNGRLLWEYPTRSHVESSPCLASGRAYIGAGDDGYYCFELAPGPNREPRLVWHVPGEQYPDAETSPIVSEGRFFAGLGLGGKALVCLDAATGRELWRLPTPFPVFTPPAVEGGRLWFGMGNGNFIETADQAAVKELDKLRKAGASEAELAAAEKNLGATGQVWCVEIATRQTLWKTPLPETVLGAVAPDEGFVYLGDRGGNFYRLDADGRETARYQARSPIVTSPAVGRELVYFVTETGRLLALRKKTLEPAWETALVGKGPFLSSPVVGRGHVYVGTGSDGLLCVGAAAAAEEREIWGGWLGGPGRGGCLDGSRLPEAGAVLGRYPVQGTVAAPAAAAGGWLWVPVADGPQAGLLGFSLEKGVAAGPLRRLPMAQGAWQSPLVAQARVFAVEGATGQPDRFLRAWDTATGKPLPPLALPAEAPGQAFTDGLRIYVRTTPHKIEAFDCHSLSKVSEAIVENPIGAPAIGQAILVAASTTGLTAWDSQSLQLLWQTGMAPLTGPVTHRQTIFLGTAAGVEAVSLADGRPRGVTPGGPPVQPLALSDHWLAWINARQELLVADARDGQVLANLPGALTNPPLVLTSEQMLFATREGLMLCRLGEFQPRLWLAGQAPLALRTPLIAARSRLYGATDRELLCFGDKDKDYARLQ